jgi:hypothetical protein
MNRFGAGENRFKRQLDAVLRDQNAGRLQINQLHHQVIRSHATAPEELLQTYENGAYGNGASGKLVQRNGLTSSTPK